MRPRWTQQLPQAAQHSSSSGQVVGRGAAVATYGGNSSRNRSGPRQTLRRSCMTRTQVLPVSGEDD